MLDIHNTYTVSNGCTIQFSEELFAVREDEFTHRLEILSELMIERFGLVRHESDDGDYIAGLQSWHEQLISARSIDQSPLDELRRKKIYDIGVVSMHGCFVDKLGAVDLDTSTLELSVFNMSARPRRTEFVFNSLDDANNYVEAVSLIASSVASEYVARMDTFIDRHS